MAIYNNDRDANEIEWEKQNAINSTPKKYLVYNILWETDGENVKLPQTIEVSIPNELNERWELEDCISNKISDITGYLHNGFSTNPSLPTQ